MAGNARELDGPGASSRGQGLQIGTAPVNWNNFDLEGWRDPVPFPAILEAMRDAGFADTEWDESFGTDPATLKQESTRREMAFTGAYRWLDLVDPNQFEQDLELLAPFLATLRDIGANHLIVADRLRPERVAIAGAVPDDGSLSLDEDGYAAIGSHLAHLAQVAGALDIAVHYHNHAGTYIETPDELDRLVAHLAPGTADLCFDTGHYAYGGGDALAFLQEHLNSIGYLHLKDVDAAVLEQAKEHRWSFQDALRHYIFCPLGEGSARVPEIVAELVVQQFGGWVIIEQDTCWGDATENARTNLETARRLAQSATS